ncbi:NYNRIN [Branchiostoma lanceolatum]|uniref:NYNRIN protein n=1 Tax=Branchiostoma lanceolatum TaxID=7740 RepID=A0A8K0EEZ6_BRALA|nr:NYNRIN [Branchiostoma lanceolatum]
MYRSEIFHRAHSTPVGEDPRQGEAERRCADTGLQQRGQEEELFNSLHKDVKAHCQSREECQKAAKGLAINRIPLIPLPIIEEPFRRIAMDVVEPLERSKTGNKYVLVVCDYATRYPEAIPMRSVDAKHVAEELIKKFARVGIPEEILTDQGTVFMSQLLK